MSDLLERMIARANGSLPAVEPVLRARYETARDAPALAEFRTEETSIPAGDRGPEEAEQPTGLAAVKANREQARAEAVERGAMLVTEQRDEWRDERTMRPETKGPVEPPARTVAASEIQSPPGLPNSPRVDAPAPAPIQIAAKQSTGTAIDFRTEIAEPTAAPLEPAARRSKVPVEATRPENPSTRRRESEIRSQALAQPVEVHVSIGHIEVRQPAPAQPGPRPAAKPQVSLDDYLRRRNGAAR